MGGELWMRVLILTSCLKKRNIEKLYPSQTKISEGGTKEEIRISKEDRVLTPLKSASKDVPEGLFGLPKSSFGGHVLGNER